MFSKKIVVQLLSEILSKFEINDVVISPGSRNAPISIHFSNHSKFNTFSIVDERSAGFIALGMSQKTQKPTVICCTSGSASVNYYPAIVEAFYQNIPLIILTADRPENYVDIFDGQTIRQKNVFENHSYGNFQLSENESNEANLNNFLIIKKAILLAIQKSGPVHINIPFSEPLYDLTEKIEVTIDEFKIPEIKIPKIDFDNLKNIWNQSNKIMFLVGMQQKNEELQKELIKISQNKNVIILTEATSNLNHQNFIQHIDPLIFNEINYHDFAPDLLITLGQNIVSKKIKSFLRNSKPKNHWHIDPFWQPNTYFCLTEKISLKPEIFLKEFNQNLENKENLYQKKWFNLEKNRQEIHENFIEKLNFCDLKAFSIINKFIPENYIIHFGNSTPIRYAQLFNFNKNIIFSNRGASGIDGATSTSIGFAIKSKVPVLMISGDLSFFYDINALWNNYIPNSFRLILINNGGGNIFKIIPGPDSSNALEKFFEAKHTKNAQFLAQHFNFDYIYVKSNKELENELSTFFDESSKAKILEINTSKFENSETLKKYMQKF